MSILANPTGGNGIGVVTLVGANASNSTKIETLAFLYGKAGVGHIFFSPKRQAKDGNVRVWRAPSAADPGQPKGWGELAPFTVGGLADHIAFLANMAKGVPLSKFTQALVFQDASEASAFLTAYTASPEDEA